MWIQRITCYPYVEMMPFANFPLREKVAASFTWPVMTVTWLRQWRKLKWKWVSSLSWWIWNFLRINARYFCFPNLAWIPYAGSLENAFSLLQSFSRASKYSSDKVLWPTLCEVKWTNSEEGAFPIMSDNTRNTI